MYLIVNYENGCKYPNTFSDFKTAFMIQQLVCPTYLIEYIKNNKKEIVGNPNGE